MNIKLFDKLKKYHPIIDDKNFLYSVLDYYTSKIMGVDSDNPKYEAFIIETLSRKTIQKHIFGCVIDDRIFVDYYLLEDWSIHDIKTNIQKLDVNIRNNICAILDAYKNICENTYIDFEHVEFIEELYPNFPDYDLIEEWNNLLIYKLKDKK